MDFLETKGAHRNASEYHLNHCQMEKGGSNTHPRPLPAALFQHVVLITILWQYFPDDEPLEALNDKTDVEQVVYYYLDYLLKQSDSPTRRTDHN